MLPIESPLDTFRVGVWGLKRNAGLVLVYVAWMTLLDLSYQGFAPEALFESAGTTGLLLIAFGMILIQFFISAMLIFPLHATFLSDGRVAGLAAIGSFDGVIQVAFRAMLIFFVALILGAIVFIVSEEVVGGFWVFTEAVDATEGGSDAIDKRLMLFLLFAFVIGVLLFGATVILLGLRIPHLVDKGNVESASSSIRRGARQFNRMAKNLAVGPGPVLIAQQIIWWALIDGPAEAIADNPFHPAMLALSVVIFLIDVFCIAMTAGVLSDAYRRALHSEAIGTVS